MGNCLCGLKINRFHFEIIVFDANLPGYGTPLSRGGGAARGGGADADGGGGGEEDVG